MHNLQNVHVSRDEERWEANIKAEIPQEKLTEYRTKALKEIQKTAKLDGFRPGHAPEARIVEVYGEDTILRRAAEMAVQQELPELLAKEQLPVVAAPKVTIEPLKGGAPLAFTATAALAPRVVLPDYKTLVKNHSPAPESELAVSDKEHGDALLHLRRERARIERLEKGAEPQKAAEEVQKLEEKDLPSLDDSFVQSLGFQDSAAFSEKMRENLQNEKGRAAHEKRRAAILDTLVGQATISYPAVLREYELDDMEAQMKHDLSRAGATLEQYLEQIKKTQEEMRAEWKDIADKRTKIRLILAEIARKENIEADPAQLEEQLEAAKKRFPDAKPDVLRANLAHALKNDAVLKFLETI